MAPLTQLPLLGSIRNSELFSSHWLKNRLLLEPEWNEYQNASTEALGLLVELWQSQRNRVEQYGSEQSLEQAFIQPVFQALGWKLIYQTHLRGRKPDYALFLDNRSLDSSLQSGRTSSDFWKYPTILADAKARHIALDRPTITGQQREYPPEQIEWYLTTSHLDYGILTNGKLWRLIPRQTDPGQPRFQTYFECDLAMLLDSRLAQPSRLPTLWQHFEDFHQFFLFFSPIGFTETLERTALVARARSGSTHYRIGVGDGLKQRVFEALRLCIQGFLAHGSNGLNGTIDLEHCRYNSLVLLYRLLFILYAEDRQLLPFGVNRAYTENRSLGRVRDEIANRLDRIRERREADFRADEITLWPDLQNLFMLIDEGASRYSTPPYNGGLFDSEAHPFLREKLLTDWYLARIIDQLGRAEDRSHATAELVRVDYRDLAIQHLGNLYEGLLEVQPHFANVNMQEIRTRDSEDEYRIVPVTDGVPKGFGLTGNQFDKGAVYILKDKGERKSSGSYYTPNEIVDYIVENTIGPLCEEIDAGLRSEISAVDANPAGAATHVRAEMEARLEGPRKDFAERVLTIRILDPAMGSGHFLIRACQYIAEQIATNPNTHDPTTDAPQGDESILTYWKRRVAETCLYGVDRNFMAVELAKLALWLETIAKSQPLTFLDHHLRHGDSLVGASFAEMRSLPDAPPMFEQVFDEKLRSTLPGVLETLAEIGSLPSTDVPHVKQKARLFHKCEAVRKPFIVLGDVWCSTFFLDKDARLTLAEYGALVELLNRPNLFKSSLNTPRYAQAMRVAKGDIVPFHWELEFAEVFHSPARRSGESAGFDVIIGNPPYDVLSEKETGKDLSGLKQLLKKSPIYKPSFVGKNNLYKLFICRSLALLADGGRLGFITPMPLLGDEQAVGIRKAVFASGTFTAVEAFPQKDNPAKRVFKDAKLSTAIGIVRRTRDANARQRSFTSRVHPANEILDTSPSLKLSATDISLYDPSNLTVVSCSQEDWNLAVRVMQSGRFQRLGSVCTSYQGEVNESTHKEFLSDDHASGQLVLRGSNVTMYVLRGASQGEDLYLDVDGFLQGKDSDSKAYRSRGERIGFQRSSPQNTFRRIVSCPIPAGEFCFDTVSYVPYSECRIPPLLLLALLNSKLLDWYFRLGSTNSKVNEYQFDNLPCPSFATTSVLHQGERIFGDVRDGRLDRAFEMLAPALQSFPFSRGIADTIVLATSRIMELEAARGQISRRERSALAEETQGYQDFVDHVLLAMADISDIEVEALHRRLATMM